MQSINQTTMLFLQTKKLKVMLTTKEGLLKPAERSEKYGI
jgi:hypothetical protein|tara:strand:+ start:350 stop:469 length:120 start_codon:yes stop_codon:yes gene_type:complete